MLRNAKLEPDRAVFGCGPHRRMAPPMVSRRWTVAEALGCCWVLPPERRSEVVANIWLHQLGIIQKMEKMKE